MKGILIFTILFLFIASVNAVDYDATKQNSGIITVLEGEEATLTLDGVTEIVLEIKSINDKSVASTIGGRALNLDIGQEREYDLDNDGVNDIIIKLNNIIDRLVSFKIQKLVLPTLVIEEVEDDTVVVEDLTTDNVLDNEVVAETSEGINKFLIGAIIVVVIIIALAFMVGGGDDSEKNYDKAMELHREGQEFHYDGDDETAEELYDKANELREKARNLEGGI